MSKRMRGLEPRAHVTNVFSLVKFAVFRSVLNDVFHKMRYFKHPDLRLHHGAGKMRSNRGRQVLVFSHHIDVIVGEVAVVQTIA